MNEVLDAVHAYISGTGILVYVIIFFGRLFDVSCSTLRIVLIGRGEKLVGSIVAFFEVVVWLLIASAVLTKPDAYKIIFYALAYACGTYLGTWIDDKLALGLSSVQIIVNDCESAHKICKELRDAGFGVSTLDAHGIDDQPRYMMLINIRRKLTPTVLKLVNSINSSAFVTVSDVKALRGGHMPSAKRK